MRVHQVRSSLAVTLIMGVMACFPVPTTVGQEPPQGSGGSQLSTDEIVREMEITQQQLDEENAALDEVADLGDAILGLINQLEQMTDASEITEEQLDQILDILGNLADGIIWDEEIAQGFGTSTLGTIIANLEIANGNVCVLEEIIGDVIEDLENSLNYLQGLLGVDGGGGQG